MGSPHDHTAETLEESRICFVPKDSFLSFMKRNPDVSLKLSQKLSRELGQAYRQVCSLVLKPPTERLAEVLLALGLLLGWQLRWFAIGSGVLLLAFALTMTFALGVKAPLDYSVFAAAAGAFCLSVSAQEQNHTRAETPP